MPVLELADRAAVRVGEQLRAEAHAEHRHAALGRLAQQRRLPRQRRVERGLLAAERHDAVDLAERGQRVAVAQEALVQARSGGLQRRAGVAQERPLEVVQDGDDGAVGHPVEASRTAWCGCRTRIHMRPVARACRPGGSMHCVPPIRDDLMDEDHRLDTGTGPSFSPSCDDRNAVRDPDGAAAHPLKRGGAPSPPS